MRGQNCITSDHGIVNGLYSSIISTLGYRFEYATFIIVMPARRCKAGFSSANQASNKPCVLCDPLVIPNFHSKRKRVGRDVGG